MENPTFSVNDLLFMKNLIEVINRRGGFQPAEMVAVGEFYNRVSAFYDYSVQQMQQPQSVPDQSVPDKTTGPKPKEK
jgi:hypothetical protein